MNDDILDILIAHGVPGAVIVRVAKLIADSQLNESRRTKNRERMKSVRARAHTQVHTETHKRASLSIPPITKKEVSKRERHTFAKRLATGCRRLHLRDHPQPRTQNHRNRFPRLLACTCRTWRAQSRLEIDLATLVQNGKQGKRQWKISARPR